MGWFGFGNTKPVEQQPASTNGQPVFPEPDTAGQTPVDGSTPAPTTVENVNAPPPTSETITQPVTPIETDVTPTRIEQFNAWGRTVLPLLEEEKLTTKLGFTVVATGLLMGLYMFARPYFFIISQKKNLPIIRRIQIYFSVGIWTSMMFQEWYLPLVQKVDDKGQPFPRSFIAAAMQDWKNMTQNCTSKQQEDVAVVTTDNANVNVNANTEK